MKRIILAAAATAVMLMGTTAFAEPDYYWHRHREYHRYVHEHHAARCHYSYSAYGHRVYTCRY